MEYLAEHSRKIAEASLSIGAIKLSPEKPFKWASGYHMPMYNDNRLLLGTYGLRMLVANGFLEIIKNEKIPCDIIAGVSTAGIAPAASVASLLNVPLAIINNGKVCLFEPELVKFLVNLCDDRKDYNVVASTLPFGIIPGVSLANKKMLPFAYVRPAKKDHGLEKQVESTISEGQSVYLIDYYLQDSYAENAKEAIIREKKAVVTGERQIKRGEEFPSNIRGARIVLIEDLISTGKSTVAEADSYKKSSAEILYCLSIFNYGFKKAQEIFEKSGYECRSQLEFPFLLGVARETKYIGDKQSKLLEEVLVDELEWGEKHGFPPEVKK